MNYKLIYKLTLMIIVTPTSEIFSMNAVMKMNHVDPFQKSLDQYTSVMNKYLEVKKEKTVIDQAKAYMGTRKFILDKTYNILFWSGAAATVMLFFRKFHKGVSSAVKIFHEARYDIKRSFTFDTVPDVILTEKDIVGADSKAVINFINGSIKEKLDYFRNGKTKDKDGKPIKIPQVESMTYIWGPKGTGKSSFIMYLRGWVNEYNKKLGIFSNKDKIELRSFNFKELCSKNPTTSADQITSTDLKYFREYLKDTFFVKKGRSENIRPLFIVCDDVHIAQTIFENETVLAEFKRFMQELKMLNIYFFFTSNQDFRSLHRDLQPKITSFKIDYLKDNEWRELIEIHFEGTTYLNLNKETLARSLIGFHLSPREIVNLFENVKRIVSTPEQINNQIITDAIEIYRRELGVENELSNN